MLPPSGNSFLPQCLAHGLDRIGRSFPKIDVDMLGVRLGVGFHLQFEFPAFIDSYSVNADGLAFDLGGVVLKGCRC